MFTPQRLAEALEDSKCAGNMGPVATLLRPTHPEIADRLQHEPFGGKLTQPQIHVHARADVLMIHLHLKEEDKILQQACVEEIYYGGKFSLQAIRLATGSGLLPNINTKALALVDLICSVPRRKAAHLARLRDHVRCLDAGGRRDGCHRATRPGEESASLGHRPSPAVRRIGDRINLAHTPGLQHVSAAGEHSAIHV